MECKALVRRPPTKRMPHNVKWILVVGWTYSSWNHFTWNELHMGTTCMHIHELINWWWFSVPCVLAADDGPSSVPLCFVFEAACLVIVSLSVLHFLLGEVGGNGCVWQQTSCGFMRLPVCSALLLTLAFWNRVRHKAPVTVGCIDPTSCFRGQFIMHSSKGLSRWHSLC